LKKLTRFQFIADQIYHKHGRYNYEKVKDVRSHSKLIICCLKHGNFEQERSSHDAAGTQSCGCPVCNEKRKRVIRKRQSSLKAYAEARAHGIKLLEELKSINHEVRYLCYCGKEHRRIYSHLKESEFVCLDTRYERSAKAQTLTFEEVWLYFAEHNCELLSKEYHNSHGKLTFQCSCGNITERSLDAFKKRPYCQECSRQKTSHKTIRAEGFARYQTLGERLKSIGVEVKESPEGGILAKCYRTGCENWTLVTLGEAYSKLFAAAHINKGASNIYCSDACKQACPIYGRQINIDHTKRYREMQHIFRNKILERDNYTCQKCGETEGKLHAHHINPHYVEYDAMALENGITLCETCHKEIHARRGCTAWDIHNLCET